MERDYDYTSAVFAEDLAAPDAIGRSAGNRAVRRLEARKAETAEVPVVFEARIANTLIGHLASAINGASVARGTSFLKDKLGAHIFPAGVTVVDDPLRRRGLRLQALRRRGRGDGPARRRRRRGADHLDPRFALGAPARA